MALASVRTLIAFAWLVEACAQPPKVVLPVAHYQGPIIDIHAHIRLADDDAASPDQPRGSGPILALDARAGVARTTLIVIARRGDPEATRAQNDAVILEAKKASDRMVAVASVHPDDEHALAEMARVRALGVRIVKLHPNTQKFDVGAQSVDAVVGQAEKLGIVLLFDGYSPFDPAQNGKFLKLAITHPRARLILAHMSGPNFRETALFAAVRKFSWYPRNVWFDLSATGRLFAGSPVAAELAWTVRAIGVDRVLFGSDWPVDTPADAVAAVRALGFTEEEESRIFYRNAAELLAP